MKAMVDFTRVSTVWASDEVILKWAEVRRRFEDWETMRALLRGRGTEAEDASAIEPVFIFEEFLLSIRRDTGYPKTKLKRGDLLGMFLNDIDRYINVETCER